MTPLWVRRLVTAVVPCLLLRTRLWTPVSILSRLTWVTSKETLLTNVGLLRVRWVSFVMMSVLCGEYPPLVKWTVASLSERSRLPHPAVQQRSVLLVFLVVNRLIGCLALLGRCRKIALLLVIWLNDLVGVGFGPGARLATASALD